MPTGEATRRPLNLYTIPPHAPFLDTLADALISGRLSAGHRFDDDPLALADVTIFLPTRRAARGFGDAIRRRLGRAATLLPMIRPLGDIDEDDLLGGAEETAGERLVLPAAVETMERRLVLARMVLAWQEADWRQWLAGGLDPQLQAIPRPGTPGDAVRLADDLARLMAAVEIEGVSWDRLGTLVPDDYAGYWQRTLDFLKIATEAWPAHLAEIGRSDPDQRRNLLINAEAERLEHHRPTAPVIAAGSTGSVMATQRLMAAIARLDRGAVVLPGLDTLLDGTTWQAIGGSDNTAPAFAHPQFGLNRLLDAFGATRDEVIALGVAASNSQAARARLVSEAMRPAETTELWSAPTQRMKADDVASGLDGVGLIEAADEEEEALAIAIALRETVETAKARAALVTADRSLARRVAAQLQRWKVAVDDSAGRPLIGMAPAVLARLVAEAALNGAEPVTVLALLQHPLTALGQNRADTRRAARMLELGILRGPRPQPGSAGLADSLKKAQAAIAAGRVRVARPIARLSAADWAAAEALIARLEQALRPLEALAAGTDKLPLPAFIAAHREALEAVSRDEAGTVLAFAAAEAGVALDAFFDQLATMDGAGIMLASGDYGGFFEALIAGQTVRPVPHGNPRIHIWGQLEARLQRVDRIVLGGLNEGGWPAETRTDPWLSRAMRRDMGLDPPERRTGLSAHDFAQGLGHSDVVLTRALRAGGAPSVASRWLQRLFAVAGAEATALLRRRGAGYLDWARRLDAPATAPMPAGRPAPAPPLTRRPTRLSVTEIEVLIRDPYAIFAKHVLRLEPLDPIDQLPDYADRGSLIHLALGDFTAEWRGRFDTDAHHRLLEVGRRVFVELEAFPEVHALWWRRFERIAGWIIDWEAGRDGMVMARHAEIAGRLELDLAGTPFTLTGRADRIDELSDGRLAIIDFKTGTPPSVKELLSGLAPQLALEAAMVRAGAFADIAAGSSIAELKWIAVSGGRPPGKESSAFEKDGPDGDAIAAIALGRLIALLARYRDPRIGYLSRARPKFLSYGGDYDHLARVPEWTLYGGEEAP